MRAALRGNYKELSQRSVASSWQRVEVPPMLLCSECFSGPQATDMQTYVLNRWHRGVLKAVNRRPEYAERASVLFAAQPGGGFYYATFFNVAAQDGNADLSAALRFCQCRKLDQFFPHELPPQRQARSDAAQKVVEKCVATQNGPVTLSVPPPSPNLGQIPLPVYCAGVLFQRARTTRRGLRPRPHVNGAFYPLERKDRKLDLTAAMLQHEVSHSLRLQVQLYAPFRRAFLIYLRLNATDKPRDAVVSHLHGLMFDLIDKAKPLERRRSVREQLDDKIDAADAAVLLRNLRFAGFLANEPLPLDNPTTITLSNACLPLCISLLNHRHSTTADLPFCAAVNPARILAFARFFFSDLFELAGPGVLELPVKKRRAAPSRSGAPKRKSGAAVAAAADDATPDDDGDDEELKDYVGDKVFDESAPMTDAVLMGAYREDMVAKDARNSKAARL